MELIKNNQNTDLDCTWPGTDELMLEYHRSEWGVPLHNDNKLFEYMVLDAFQAGLSWKTILHKRENFRRAFDGFNAIKIASYSEEKIQDLIQDASIIRNQLKIRATVNNAQRFLEIQAEYGTFDKFIWQFTNGKSIDNQPNNFSVLACTSAESDLMSKELIRKGFKFVGSTICYAFMQAAGMVNDHYINCSCRK